MKRRILSFLLVMLLVMGILPMTALASETPAVDTDGDGYVEIDTAEKLWWFAQQVNGGSKSLNAELTASIDLASTCGEGIGNWMPIGNKYSGHFNGQGYTISNLYMTGNELYVGLFGCIYGATIENVSVTGSVSTTMVYDESYNYAAAGGIVAYMDDGTIRNCHVDMTVSGGSEIGGICGTMYDGLIEDCTVDGNVICNALPDQGSGFCIGGIVGSQYGGTVRGCVNRAAASAENSVYFGGIAGLGAGDAIENCLNYGTFHAIYDSTSAGGTTAGGIVGTSGTVMRGCGNLGSINISGTGEWTGGIVGLHQTSSSIVENCYNVGSITTSDGKFGFIVGIADEDAIETNSYYLSDTTTEDGGRTAEAFASGQVAYELNGSTTTETSVWRQTIGADPYPVLSGALVYYNTYSYCDGTAVSEYGNTQTDTDLVHLSQAEKLLANNDGTHNVVYSCCEAVITENIPCTLADCTKDSVCDCGYEREAAYTQHDFTGESFQDGNHHWRKCVNCQQTGPEEDHSGNDDGDCTTRVLCDCGYVMMEGNPEHSFDGRIFHDDTQHYEGCSACGTPKEGTSQPHQFTNEFDPDCNAEGCAYIRDVQGLTDNGRTLSLNAEICINQYVGIDLSGYDSSYIQNNGGLLVWTAPVEEASAVYGNETQLYQGLTYGGEYNGKPEYWVQSGGIAAKEYADEMYIRVYLKLKDGTYLYTPLKEYSAQIYCNNILEKDPAEDEKLATLQPLCRNILEYGASAQLHFNYNIDDLANASIK